MLRHYLQHQLGNDNTNIVVAIKWHSRLAANACIVSASSICDVNRITVLG